MDSIKVSEKTSGSRKYAFKIFGEIILMIENP